MTDEAKLAEIRACAEAPDWQQVVQNGGPPCFHVEDGHFCLRAEGWQGHGLKRFHSFMPLSILLGWLLDQFKERTAELAEHRKHISAWLSEMYQTMIDSETCSQLIQHGRENEKTRIYKMQLRG